MHLVFFLSIMKYKNLALLTIPLLLAGSQAVNAIPEFINPVGYRSVYASKPNRRFFVANFRPVSGSLQYTIGGAVRSENACAVNPDDDNFMAITAENAATTKSHPEFFVSIPELNGDKQGMLIVKNESESYYEEAAVVVPATGGIVGLQLPDSAPPLAEGTYSWFLQIQCGATPLVEDPSIGGKVERVALNVPAFNSLNDEVEFYASNNIWTDSFSAANALANSGDFRYQDVLLESISQ